MLATTNGRHCKKRKMDKMQLLYINMKMCCYYQLDNNSLAIECNDIGY